MSAERLWRLRVACKLRFPVRSLLPRVIRTSSLSLPFICGLIQLRACRSPGDGLNLSQPEVGARPGIDADLSAVAGWARGRGLSVVQQSKAARTLQLAGTVRSFSQAFGVQLQTWRYRGEVYRDRIGVLHIPESLSGVVMAVLGLDNRPLEGERDTGSRRS
jgi:hypothetical protein